MQDTDIDNLLRDWSNAQLPDDETREKILCEVLARPKRRPVRRIYAAVLSAIAAVAATIVFTITLPPEPTVEIPVVLSDGSDEVEKVQTISLIVLKRLPDSEAAVEFLEDSIFVAQEQRLHELEMAGHRFFLWIYPLEETLFSLDIGIDNAAETGIAIVPDRPQALHFTSNGDRFDVFVSVLPHS